MQIVGLVHNTIYNEAAHDALLFHWGKVLILQPPAKNIEHGNIYIHDIVCVQALLINRYCKWLQLHPNTIHTQVTPVPHCAPVIKKKEWYIGLGTAC